MPSGDTAKNKTSLAMYTPHSCTRILVIAASELVRTAGELRILLIFPDLPEFDCEDSETFKMHALVFVKVKLLSLSI